MEIKFKFEIGQTVSHISSTQWQAEKQSDSEKIAYRWGSAGNEQRFFIVERFSQECPGGVQKHYFCRGVSRNGGVTKDYFKFNEIELTIVPWPPINESAAGRKGE